MFSLLHAILFMMVSFFIPIVHGEDKIKELTKRVEELEKLQEEYLTNSSEPYPEVNSFFYDKLTMGGFFEPSYTIIAGPDTELQTGSHSHIFGLNFAATFTKKIRFVSQFVSFLTVPLTNEHNDPNAPIVSTSFSKRREYNSYVFDSAVAQGYAEYFLNQHVSIQAGLGYVPFGHFAQLREPVLFMRRGGPQLLRTTDLFIPYWMGINLVGTLPHHNAGYNIYTAPSVEQSQKPGLGARFWKSMSDDKMIFGLSSQIGKNDADTYEVLGADLKYQFGTFKIITEYVTQIAKGENPWSAVITPSFSIYKQEILFYCFADYASASQNQTGTGDLAIADPYRKWEFGGGINWLPSTFTRYRAGLTFHDYIGGRATLRGQNRDYTSLDFSVGVAF